MPLHVVLLDRQLEESPRITQTELPVLCGEQLPVGLLQRQYHDDGIDSWWWD